MGVREGGRRGWALRKDGGVRFRRNVGGGEGGEGKEEYEGKRG